MTPFFSIIVPVCNGAQYLRESLDSVYNQTYRYWECICVNDGSQDETAAILAEYSALDVRFRVLTFMESNGVSKSRNAALDVALGEYVTFLDADDALCENWLAYAFKAISANSPDLIRFQYIPWFDGQKCPNAADGNSEETLDGRERIVEWGWRTLLCGGHSWLLFVRRHALGDVRFPENLSVREDVVFDMDALMRMKRIYTSNFKGYFYRMRKNSAWHRPRGLSDAMNFPLACRRIYLNQVHFLEDSRRKDDAISCYVRALLNNLLEWGVMGDRNARKYDGKVVDATKSALQPIGERAFELAGRWSFPLKLAMRFQSLLPLMGVVRLFQLKGKMTSLVKAMMPNRERAR